MGRKVAYWVSTVIVSALSLFAAYAYLLGGSQAVQGFAAVGYPQQLRIILGIAKPLGAIVLLIPGFLRLKEWAYAGVHIRVDLCILRALPRRTKTEAFFPVGLLILLAISYFTRPVNRKLAAAATA